MTWSIEPPKMNSLMPCFGHCVKFRVRVSVWLVVRVSVGLRVRVSVGFRVRVSPVCNIN